MVEGSKSSQFLPVRTPSVACFSYCRKKDQADVMEFSANF
jgi:hypothetical protein